MLRDAGVEAIGCEKFATTKQAKARLRHDEMQITGLRVNRAVSLGHRDLGRRADFEAHAAAVAAAGMRDD